MTKTIICSISTIAILGLAGCGGDSAPAPDTIDESIAESAVASSRTSESQLRLEGQPNFRDLGESLARVEALRSRSIINIEVVRVRD